MPGDIVVFDAAQLQRDGRQLQRLKVMRRAATGLLLLMACVFAIAQARLGQHPAWAWVRAFAEAAMVGAMADWFAVVALFRRPLGLPVWHTAILPNKKDEIARSLGEFVESHFVTVEAIVARANGLQADLIAVTGDVVDGTVAQLGSHTAPLGELRARAARPCSADGNTIRKVVSPDDFTAP